MTVLYLVRHAHADWTPDENRPLSLVGLKDAQRVADVLENYSITQVLSSPSCRARETIGPIAGRSGLKILEENRFQERALGDIGISSFKDAVYRTWLDMDFAFPNGESNRQAQRRAMEGLGDYLHSTAHTHIVISTHGNLLALILNHFDPGIAYPFWQDLTLPDIYQLDLDQTQGPILTRLWQPLTAIFQA